MRAALLLSLVLLTACGRVADGTRDALNKGGEMAGSAATEVIEGVATGVEKSWAMDVRLSHRLKASRIGIGKTMVESGALGNDNRLVIYLTADSAFADTVRAIAYDQDGTEMGRARAAVALNAGSAEYIELVFQDRTDLERKSRIELH